LGDFTGWLVRGFVHFTQAGGIDGICFFITVLGLLLLMKHEALIGINALLQIQTGSYDAVQTLDP